MSNKPSLSLCADDLTFRCDGKDHLTPQPAIHKDGKSRIPPDQPTVTQVDRLAVRGGQLEQCEISIAGGGKRSACRTTMLTRGRRRGFELAVRIGECRACIRVQTIGAVRYLAEGARGWRGAFAERASAARAGKRIACAHSAAARLTCAGMLATHRTLACYAAPGVSATEQRSTLTTGKRVFLAEQRAAFAARQRMLSA